MQTIQAIIAFTLYAVIGYIAKVNAKTIVSVIDHLLRVARGQERDVSLRLRERKIVMLC